MSSKKKVVSDIALILLRSRSKIDPAYVATENPSEGDTHYVAGWGQMADDDDNSNLMYTTVKMLDSDECEDFEPKDVFDDDTSICATSST